MTSWTSSAKRDEDTIFVTIHGIPYAHHHKRYLTAYEHAVSCITTDEVHRMLMGERFYALTFVGMKPLPENPTENDRSAARDTYVFQVSERE